MKSQAPAIAALLACLWACGLFGTGARSEPAKGDERATTHEAASPRARGELKIATWNLEWLHRETSAGPVPRSAADYARLRRYARALDADVIALQEVDGAEAAARVFDPQHYAFHVSTGSDRQRTGFAYRRSLEVMRHPDYEALDVGQVRVGVDLSVSFAGRRLRMLSVHLKSGCFSAPLTSPKASCRKLAAQVSPLESWIDARAAEGVAAVVIGDFNRRLFTAKPDPLWAELDDAEPPASDLWAPTAGRTSQCWGGTHPQFVDHIVLNRPALAFFVRGSFEEQLYLESDRAHQRVLSDHCPSAIKLTARPQPTASARRGERAPTAPDRSQREQRIKGNVSSSGRRLYHAPGCPSYERTKIDESKGERWFESAAEAEGAGFTKPAGCP